MEAVTIGMALSDLSFQKTADLDCSLLTDDLFMHFGNQCVLGFLGPIGDIFLL